MNMIEPYRRTGLAQSWRRVATSLRSGRGPTQGRSRCRYNAYVVCIVTSLAWLVGAGGATAAANPPVIVRVDENALSTARPDVLASDAHMTIVGKQGAHVTDAVIFRSLDGRFLVDVAEYEPVTLKLVDWPVDELMYLLQGQVAITDQAGNSRTYGAGDSFLMPRGFNGSWHQSVSVKKIAVSYSARTPSSGAIETKSAGKRSVGIASLSALNLRGTESRMRPVEAWDSFLRIIGNSRGRYVEVPVYRSSDGKAAVHVKRFERVTLELKNWPIDEFMHFLSGRVEITDAGGAARTYGPGDAIVIPQGFSGTWRQEDTIDMITAAYQSVPK